MARDIEPWADGAVMPLHNQHTPFITPLRYLTRGEAAVYEQGRTRAAEMDVRWQLQGQAARCQAEHAKETQKHLLDTTESFVDNLNVADPEVKRLTSGSSDKLLQLHQAGQLGYYQTTMLGTDEILGRRFLPPRPTLLERLTGEG